MKTIFLSAAAALVWTAFSFTPTRLAAQAGQLLFTAHLTGAEENPAVVTDGEGVITVLISEDRSKMQVNAVVTNMSGPVTAAHIHAGAIGQNGGVLVDFSSIRSGNRISGELPVPAGFLQKALTLGLYANVHTAMHPGGEVRGQLRPETDLYFRATLNGLEEVPPVLTTAIGVGSFQITLGHKMLQYRIAVHGLSGPITAAHIHKGAVGVAGGVVRALSFSGSSLVGEIPLDSLPADFLDNALNGQYYVNVHTAANPTGEIRSQLTLSGYLNGFATLNGDQETPPVTTSAFGFGVIMPNATMDSLIYWVGVEGLSGPATAAHVHKGAAGVAGGVVFPLSTTPAPNLYFGTAPMDSVLLTSFLNNGLYFNVHTAASPTGEIRGQIQTSLRKAYAFDLCAAQENPANSSTAYGAGMVSVDQGNLALNYKLLVDGLSGPATAAHIHNGNAGTNGGVKFPLVTPNPYSAGAIAITGNDAVQIADGGTYMNVHTAANPGGEVRGQVRRSLTCSLSSAVFDPAIEMLQVFPNPAKDAVHIRFNTSESFRGQLRLSDMTGRVLLQQSVNTANAGQQEARLPVETLAPGMYYLHLLRDNRVVFVQPVVKM